MKKSLYYILTLIVLFACEKQSENILSSGKMEDVLYDYHLAQGMLEGLRSAERDEMAQAYIDAVFEKHNITEAQFDSSLVWYNRHTESLGKIYANIKERLTADNQELALASGNEVMTVFSENGDTTNIWGSSRLTMLRAKGGMNFENFTIQADSTFRRKDKFVLVCTPIIISESSDQRDNYINIGLTITYKDGKTEGTTLRSNSTRDIQMNLQAKEDKDIASVSTFFYYRAKDELRNLALISNIGLIRMRTEVEQQKTEEAKDSLISDSTETVKELDLPRERLTPEQMRKRNQTDTKIDIKEAPDVRTPNSIGPRRRQPTQRRAR